MQLAEGLRNETGLRVLLGCGGGSFKSQMKRADKSGAEIALLLGEDELSQQRVTAKPLRSGEEQQAISWQALSSYLNNRFKS